MSTDIQSAINNDPFIYNLLSDTPRKYTPVGDFSWINIPTSWTSEGGNDASITMLSVYTYSGDECTNISTSI